jgi:hypothetical protein
MTNEQEVTIEQTGPGAYRVRTAAGTEHDVTVPSELVAELGGHADEQGLVRESFSFLLEREPATSILRAFQLDEIARYFPDYPNELRKRMA